MTIGDRVLFRFGRDSFEDYDLTDEDNCGAEGIVLKEYLSGALLIEDVYPNMIGEYDVTIARAEDIIDIPDRDIIDIPDDSEYYDYVNPIWGYAAIALIVLPLIIKVIEAVI